MIDLTKHDLHRLTRDELLDGLHKIYVLAFDIWQEHSPNITTDAFNIAGIAETLIRKEKDKMTDDNAGLNEQQAKEFYRALNDAKNRLRFAEQLCYQYDERIMARIVHGLADTVEAVFGVDIRPEQTNDD